jgi:hypothetical protein
MNWNKEVAILVATLAAGALLGPILVFLVGQTILGPYAAGAGLGAFYGNFWQELGGAEPIPWIMLLGPYILVQWLRLLGLAFRKMPKTEPAE